MRARPTPEPDAPQQYRSRPARQTPASLGPTLRTKRTETSGSMFGLLAILAFLAVLALYGNAIALRGEGSITSFAFGGLLIGAGAVVIRLTARNEKRFDLASIMALGLALRYVGTYFRLVGAADALLYDQHGKEIATSLRVLDFTVSSGRNVPGTGSLDYMSGIVHVFTFDDFMATMLVFTLVSYVGAALFYLAFVRGVPNGDHRRYALLVFLLPSLVYWPSSLGKEAWMQFAIGLSALGASYIFTRAAFRGLLLTGIGLAAIALIRPHVALIVVASLAVGALARGDARSKVTAGGRIFAVALVLLGGALLTDRTAQLLKLDDLGTEEVAVAFDETELRTSQGDARFTPVRVTSPVQYPAAFVTVLFRPFPGEAGDVPGLLASSETILIFVVLAASWKRLRHLPRLLVRTNYLAFAGTFVVIFVYAFSVVGNFGILVRQRTQALDLFLVFAALPLPPAIEKAGRRTPHRAASSAPADDDDRAGDDATGSGELVGADQSAVGLRTGSTRRPSAPR